MYFKIFKKFKICKLIKILFKIINTVFLSFFNIWLFPGHELYIITFIKAF